MTTWKTPPKNAQAVSQPSITAAVVWANVGHTKQYRDRHAVKIRAWQTRRRPVPGSGINPIRPKSTCTSRPGAPSATRTVTARPRRGPHSSATNRSSVRAGTTTPRRASN